MGEMEPDTVFFFLNGDLVIEETFMSSNLFTPFLLRKSRREN